METFNCVPNVTKTKLRPNLMANFYHNVPRNLRPVGSEYTVPNCTSRRSTSSLTHTFPWQERPPLTPISCIGVEHKSSKGKLCSIALAIASFVVLVAVLAIAGLALYMGVLHTESPNAVITFSCSAKILKGDRFIGVVKEKIRRYKRNLETLYQKSILRQAFITCTVDKFGNDTVTIYFKLAFNRMKLNRNISSIEKTIKDILITDAISRHPVFKNIRFDPRHITVRQTLSNDMIHHINSSPSLIKPSDHPTKGAVSTKTSVVLRSHNKTSSPISGSVKNPIVSKEKEQIKEVLPMVQGSFKISKTDADITEKKTEQSTVKSKILEKITTPFHQKKTSIKESAVTSAVYKIAAVEKVTKQPDYFSLDPETESSLVSSTYLSSTLTTIISTTSKPTTLVTDVPTNPIILNPFDDAPWIPILPNMYPLTNKPHNLKSNSLLNIQFNVKPTSETSNQNQPVYTSFTNPGLSFYFKDAEKLGLTSIKSHPIPINKIPLTDYSTMAITEHLFTLPNNEHVVEQLKIPRIQSSTSLPRETTRDTATKSPFKTDKSNSMEFIEIETFQYVPEKKEKPEFKKEHFLTNISSIFHNLASSIDTSNLDVSVIESSSSKPKENEDVSGKGQVEVVLEDDLVMHTTKHSLVTLLPVKSNSGIGRPIRRRPFRPEEPNMSVENRSFPNTPLKTNVNSEKNKNQPSKADNFKIVGVLNFATEDSIEKSNSDIIRYPKMGSELSSEQLSNTTNKMTHLTNSSIIIASNNSNILTAEEIQQLSEISKITDNSSLYNKEPVILNKAIYSSASYTNVNGLPILTKPHSKVNYSYSGTFPKEKISDCTNSTVMCGDGTCISETTKCNQLIDCNDGADEENCNCADYLKSQFLLGKICDGVIDCWDYSDENKCEWCRPDQYVCSNSKVCVNKGKICNGIKECPLGDDERQCVTIATDVDSTDTFPYYSEGYLMVRKYGQWGKLCVDNFENVVSLSQIAWQIPDLGTAVCKSMTYQSMSSVKTVTEATNTKDSSRYFELTYSLRNEMKSNMQFKSSNCTDKKIVKVKCQSLECGARPQVVKHIARVVGGGNAGLGAWPWQAALYKEGEFQCGATILSDRWLVSAGHCFYHAQDDYWVARLGALRRGTSLPSPYEQLQPVVKIIVHPGYVDSGFINDISLLQLQSSVIFSDYVRPVCLPQPNQAPMDGRLCTVIGWGQLFEVGRIFPDTLQEVQIPIISTAECRKRTLFLSLYRITEDMFCAGYERGGRDACLGDSGGPLLCPESNGRWTLQGITSNGYGCARANRPGVYTKVANYVDWIAFNINNEQLDTEYSKNILRETCNGHRCPLGECLPESRLCNGFIECSDGSDEKNCTNKKSSD